MTVFGGVALMSDHIRKKMLCSILVFSLCASLMSSCKGEDGSNSSQTEGTSSESSLQTTEASSESTSQTTEGSVDIKLESGDITGDNVAEVCKILKEAGLSNLDVFETWVRTMPPEDSESDSSTGFSDADCRMTVMLLAGDSIRFNSVEKEYKGSYLMFDVDAIENNETFEILRDKEDLFTTLFGEMPISESSFADTLPDNWSKHGISFDNEKCSIISILCKTIETDEAFVGHTGILIDSGSKYVFVEKIAFNDKFKITVTDSEEELISVLSQRPEYRPEDGDPATVIYKNTEKIGEIDHSSGS